MNQTEKLLLEYLAVTHELTAKLVKSLLNESPESGINQNQKVAISKTGNDELTDFEKWLLSKANEQSDVNRVFDIEIVTNNLCVKFLRSGNVYSIPKQTNTEFMKHYFDWLVKSSRSPYPVKDSEIGYYKLKIIRTMNQVKIDAVNGRHGECMIGDYLMDVFRKPIDQISGIEILAYCLLKKGEVEEFLFEWE